MKTTRTLVVAGALLCTLSLSSFTAAEEPTYSGFLGDYAGFVAEADSQLEYNMVWVKPRADAKTVLQPYSKFLLETVTVFPHPKADYKGLDPGELAK